MPKECRGTQFVPHALNLSRHLFAKPNRFNNFHVFTIPEKFLLKVESWTEEIGEDAIFIVALKFF